DMRKTNLKRASIGVVIVILAGAAGLGVLRASMNQPDETQTERGAALFADKGCANCHYTDKTETKTGPGLKNLFGKDTLPASGRPATEENVRLQLHEPYAHMPSYSGRLTGEEEELIISYLRSL
ncbi:MAG: cytochrome c, partial [Syntrophales bacterium]|nr:cytochrome c [Syntrophales bacterium]